MGIAVFGLGKLGCVLAALHAAKGHEVVGIDVMDRPVELLNNGVAPVLEPQLQDLIDQAGSRLTATTDAQTGLQGVNLAYIIVPTPSDETGVFSNEYVIDAVKAIGRNLRETPRRFTVVIASTVMPGSCDGPITQAIEASSGLKVGKEIGLVYSPEFIALGSIVRDMTHPDLTLIGESDTAAGDLAIEVAKTVVENDPQIKRMSLASAEVTKISINTYVTTKISFANMLSEICDQLPGADIDDVTQAVGADSRVGTKYLKGALGYGGPCFPRDNRALSEAAKALGVSADIAVATDLVNDRQVQRMVNLITNNLPTRESKVAILGLAYKQDTPVCERSQAIDIANALHLGNTQVLVHDPLVSESDNHGLLEGIKFMENAKDLSSTDVVVVTQALSAFEGLGLDDFADKTVIDVWGLLSQNSSNSFSVIRPGR